MIEVSLNLSIRKNCNFIDFCTELIERGREKWLHLYLSQGGPMPDFTTWEQFRDAVEEAAGHFWQIAHPDQMPEIGKPSAKRKCYQAIVEGIYKMFPNWMGTNPPLAYGKPISQYRLIKIIQEKHRKLTETTCRKYARLWLLGWKTINPDWVSRDDMNFLMKYDRRTHQSVLKTRAWLEEFKKTNPQAYKELKRHTPNNYLTFLQNDQVDVKPFKATPST